MSAPDPEAVATAPSLKRKDFSKEGQDDLDDLDRIFGRIRKVAPPVPYLLSVPSMNPYRLGKQEANAFKMGHLWQNFEEHLQYQTYAYREPSQDCLELQAGEDDEPGPQRPESRASNVGKKKSYNLSSLPFKVTKANGTATPGSMRVSPNPSQAQAVQAHVNGANKPEEAPKQESKAANRHDARTDPSSPTRKSGRPSIEARDGRKDAEAAQVDGDNPRQDTRPGPASPSRKPALADSKLNIDKSQSDRTPHNLPPLLSPVHEPPRNPHDLPNILSPSLPSNIQAELDKLETQRKRAASSASTSSSDRKSQTLVVSDARSQKPSEPAKVEPRIRAVSMNGKPPNAAVAKPNEKHDPSLMVKLKFSKAKAPTVGQILRLPPKRRPVETKERQDTPANTQTKEPGEEPKKKKKPIPMVPARRSDNTTAGSTPSAKPTTTSTLATKLPEKRPRTEDENLLSVPNKRPRAASTHDRPITPMQQGISSPALSSRSSAKKGQAQYTTPKNNPKAVGMLRTGSTESADSTPGRSVATPAGVKVEGKSAPTSAPVPANKQDISLAKISMNLNNLGRTLKHEVTRMFTSSNRKLTKQDEKRAAVTNMECILSYVAAYYAQDASSHSRGRGSDVESTWKTLLPLCISYARITKDFQHLDGLRSYLSYVIATAICTHVSQRAPDPSTAVANLALLADHTKHANQHFNDARNALGYQDIQSHFKKTFAAREEDAKLCKAHETIVGARLAGPFFLPIGNDTTPIQAVRFGLKFLAEYCEKEKLEYTLRLNLEDTR